MSSRRAAGSPASPRTAADAFTMLVVCSGNICRSPLVEQLFRARIEQVSPPSAAGAERDIVLSSAGTIALTGEPMPEQAAELSVRYGGDPSLHRARDLRAEHIAAADLVIAMSREHRSAIVRMVPRANRYTFTLRELALLLTSVSQDPDATPEVRCATLHADLRALVPLVAARRGVLPPPADPEEWDVVDPYRRSQATYERSATQCVDAVDAICAAVLSMTDRKGEDGFRRLS